MAPRIPQGTSRPRKTTGGAMPSDIIVAHAASLFQEHWPPRTFGSVLQDFPKIYLAAPCGQFADTTEAAPFSSCPGTVSYIFALELQSHPRFFFSPCSQPHMITPATVLLRSLGTVREHHCMIAYLVGSVWMPCHWTDSMTKVIIATVSPSSKDGRTCDAFVMVIPNGIGLTIASMVQKGTLRKRSFRNAALNAV
eukprot:3718875-Amphidinium_carterae.1